MTITANPSVRQVLGKIVTDPAYRALARKRLIPWPHIAVVALAYGVFIGSTWAYLAGSIPFLVMLLLNQFAIYASFTPMHDAMHKSVSRNSRVNDWLGTFSIFLLVPGLGTTPFRALHMEHHRWVGDRDKDPDVPLVESPKSILLFVLMFPEYLWIKFYFGKLASTRPKREVTVLIAGLVVYIGLHVGLLLSPYAMEFTLCWLIPQRLGMTILIYAFGHIQHPENADWTNSPFQATVTVKATSVSKIYWLGQTDHCIHHAMPHIPFHRYHKVWALGDNILRKQGIPERGLFRKAGEIQWPRAPYIDTRRVRVSEVSSVGRDIVTCLLEGVDEALPMYSPGSHIDVHLPSGRVRQYSLCGPQDGSYRIAVKKLPGGRGGSIEVHEALLPGLEVTISEPRNNFELCDARHHVLIAGGIGVTPLLAMARHLWDEGKSFELHLCAPDSESVPFGATLNELPFNDRIAVHTDSAPGRASIEPGTHVGRWEGGAEIYMCGPAGFMDWLQSSAVELGWPLDTIHRESFTAPVVDVTNTRPFEIVLARAGVTLQVPAGRAILDVLVENKFEMQSGCGQGVCGSCVTPVLEGELEHRDAVLPAAVRAANTAMCICVSRAKCDRIVLDI